PLHQLARPVAAVSCPPPHGRLTNLPPRHHPYPQYPSLKTIPAPPPPHKWYPGYPWLAPPPNPVARRRGMLYARYSVLIVPIMEAVMRLCLSLAALGWVLLASASPARAEEKPKDLIQKAIKAQGGLDTLTLERASHRKKRGMVYFSGPADFYGQTWGQKGGKLRMVHTTGQKGGVQSKRILVNDGERAWMRIDGFTMEMPQDMLAKFKQATHVDR